ncbi:hypothetical protein ACEPPN_010405 [Leptodophora sp. 'Broadleaf-Isolate-01']
MATNPGGGGKLPKGVTQEQLDLARAMQESMAQGGKQRPGRGRSTAPSPASSRGRGPAMASTRPSPSPNPSLKSFTSRTTHAPGATRSGVVNPHYGQQYTVGASTPLPTFKSPQRQRAASPVRSYHGPTTVPTKPKSPPKFVRDSILVPDHTQPMILPGVCTTARGPQDQSLPAEADSTSAWVNVPEQSSAYVAPVPENGGWNTAAPQNFNPVDPRFMSVASPHPMTQQSSPISGGFGQGAAPQAQTMPSAQATTSFGGSQAQGSAPQAGRLAGQSVPNAGRVPITTNWTDDDPTKPIIPGHLRQPNAEDAVREIAGMIGWAVSDFSADGVSIGTGRRVDSGISCGVSSSIYAPGNARGNRVPTEYQADVNGSDWMFTAASAKLKTGSVRVPSGDGDVEMSDGPTNTQPSAPQKPVEWDNLPKLSSSKYATPSTFSNRTAHVPKPAPTFNTGKENVKPPPQLRTQDFGDIGKNIAADVAKSFGVKGAAGQNPSNPFVSNNVGASNQDAQVPTGFGAAAQNVAINPFQVNSVHAAQNTPDSNVFGAPSVPFVWGSVDHSAVHDHSGFGNGQPVAPAQLVQNNTPNNGFGGPSAPGAAPWGSVDHSASNGQTGFGVAHPVAPAQTFQTTSNPSGFGGPSAPVNASWGSIDHSTPNGKAGFGVAPADVSQTTLNSNHFGGPSTPAAAPWGLIDHSVSNGYVGFGTGVTQPAASTGNVWDSANHSLPNGTAAQQGSVGFPANGFGAPIQSAAQFANGWGTAAQPAANGQYNQGGPSSSDLGVSQPGATGQTTVNPVVTQYAGNPQAGHGFGMSQPANAGQGTHNPFMSNAGFGAGSPAQNPFTLNGFGATSSNLEPAKAPGNAGLDASTVAKNLANDLRGMFSGESAAKQPSYEASPFGPPAVRSAAAPNASNGRQTGSTQTSLYQVVPGKQKVAGLAESRWS